MKILCAFHLQEHAACTVMCSYIMAIQFNTRKLWQMEDSCTPHI